MEKSKSKFLKVSFIGLFVTLCLFIFPFFMAQKSNAFYFDYKDGSPSFDYAISGTSSYSYYNFNMLNNSIIDSNVLNQLKQEFPTLYDNYYDCNYNTYYFALFDDSTGNAFVECYDYGILTRYVELYIEYVGTPFDSSNSLYSHLDRAGFIPFFNNSSNNTYFRSFVDSLYSHYFQSSGYTEQEYQDYGNLKYQEGYTEGENQGKISGVQEFKNSQEYRDALSQAERDGYSVAESSNRQSIQSIFHELYPWYVYEPMSNVSEDVRYNLKELVDESNFNTWNEAIESLAYQLNEVSISFDNNYRFEYYPFVGSSEENFNFLAYENMVSLSNSLRNEVYKEGIELGRTDGLEMSDTMMKTFKQIFSAPSYVLGGIFNFDFLGVNIYNLLTFLMSTFLLIFIFKKILGL